MQSPLQALTPEFWVRQWRELNAAAAAFAGYQRAATWNALAPGYGRQPHDDDKDEQVGQTLARLQSSGVRFEGAAVLDIGCGPGRYAQAFAQRGARVVCLDVSENMLARLRGELPAATLERIALLQADWQTLDVKARGLEYAFDLVFANMTPAIAGPEAFMKLMQASRQWCWFRGWAGPRENPALERLHVALFGTPPRAHTGNFLCAYNLACASGHFPDCTFSSVQWTQRTPLAECIDFYRTFFRIDEADGAEELTEIIQTCLSQMAVDGFIENTVRGHTGGMLWSVT